MISFGEIVVGILTWGPGILLAVTLHEWAHGYVATLFGDPTPRLMGRLSLSPLPHIDPVWTLLVPVLMLVVSMATTGQPFVFGGAKPVPINPRHFHPARRRLAMFCVSIAGPCMNFLLGLVCVVAMQAVFHLPGFMENAVLLVLLAALKMNVILAVFNLLPILPLDGGRVLSALLPPVMAIRMARLERYGLPIVVLLAFSGVLGTVLFPVASSLMAFYLKLAGLM